MLLFLLFPEVRVALRYAGLPLYLAFKSRTTISELYEGYNRIILSYSNKRNSMN